VAILTKADARWVVLHNQVLIPGYAVMVNVSHRVSRESFWILGVYGDISQGQASLLRFLTRLQKCLQAFVPRQAKAHWGGCFAIGDWNFVEHAGDRYPTGGTTNASKQLLECFKEIKALCCMRDVSGQGPAPRAWSYSKNTHNGVMYSHLDRIYRPTLGWSSGKVVPIDTNWSDHRIITAIVHVEKPRIEKAVPTPRLPGMEVLEKTREFWPKVLLSWDKMSGDGPVTLEKWKAFKDTVLDVG